MPQNTQTALVERKNQAIQRINDNLGKGVRCDLSDIAREEVYRNLNFIDLRKGNNYEIALMGTKHNEGDRLVGTLSIPLAFDLKNFVLLKSVYNHFGEDITSMDFYQGTVSSLHHNFKGDDLESAVRIHSIDSGKVKENESIKCFCGSYGIYASAFSTIFGTLLVPEVSLEGGITLGVTLGMITALISSGLESVIGDKYGKFVGLSSLFHKSGIFRFNLQKEVPYLSKRMIQLADEEKAITKEIDEAKKYKESAEERLELGSEMALKGSRELRNFEKGLRHTRNLKKNILSLSSRKDSLTNRITKREKELDEYFDSLNQRRGIHIITQSTTENAYEIITDFYTKLLNPRMDDFDIISAVKEIAEGWGEVKKLPKAK